jgi:hypothetical protein
MMSESVEVLRALAWPAVVMIALFILKKKDKSVAEDIEEGPTIVSVCGPVISLDRAVSSIKCGDILRVRSR